jgi:hypothetical protein
MLEDFATAGAHFYFGHRGEHLTLIAMGPGMR